MRHVAEIRAYFGERLAAMEFEEPASLRIRGMSIAVEAGEDEGYVPVSPGGAGKTGC